MTHPGHRLGTETRWTALRAVLARRDVGLVAIVAACVLAAYAPTLLRLAQGPWRTEQEGHGPLILAAALWIAWQQRDALAAAALKPAAASGWVVLFGGLVGLVLGRSQDVLFVEALALMPIVAGCVLVFGGWSALRALIVPIGFLVFAAPPPGWLVDAVTVPLKVFVSDAVTQTLYRVGYPIAQNGVMIQVGPYQLLVEDACAGMNSIFALSAVGIFYVYMLGRAAPVRNALLLAAILPITVAANYARVLALVLLAYHAGPASIEGIFHDLTGMGLFVVALLLLVVLDGLIGLVGLAARRLLPSRSRPAPAALSPAAPSRDR